MASNGATSASGSQEQGLPDLENVDPIWMSSRTARQIYALGEVEKVKRTELLHERTFSQAGPQDISRLLSLAAQSMALLSLPQTDGPEDDLPQGAERSEKFVDVANEYFERLDNTLPHLTVHPHRHSLLARTHPPVAHRALRDQCASAQLRPPPLGVGLPSADPGGSARGERGLQEERVERDAWKGILDALTRLKEARDKEQTGSSSSAQSS
ncbi:hypothetical protein BN946_scf185007.g221 [Trametes cinnabarina]|uniref:Mediator of RNA polymerase II transcription subunit 11 n=1 Tax=Pycnoporus cinnabarinus TaxID=5643 RepID=A0A060SG16_PYCCI|nr:hypothetical protein BN946_scf185007.g221 [Trametes cinnabarina]